MTEDWKCFALQETCRPSEDGSLLRFLRENSGHPVRIDAAKLRRLDARLVELLLCAAGSWRSTGQGFEVVNLTAENAEVLSLLGATPDLLERSIAA